MGSSPLCASVYPSRGVGVRNSATCFCSCLRLWTCLCLRVLGFVPVTRKIHPALWWALVKSGGLMASKHNEVELHLTCKHGQPSRKRSLTRLCARGCW
ncbi:hypothetical protein GDO81_016089 [Engystomops pustulosus]|uniref:Secreted protein n=1 Tax=Engystomops pustulosus TaxID=76066 RepID=A0AAV7AVA0_ENGPU|nr:hypothetical protein GDO81_016089 [Engystomops pustulosus]